MLVAALPDEERTFAGFVTWRGHRARANCLLPHRHPAPPKLSRAGRRVRAQCLLADYLFSTTLANRVEAGTEA